MVKPVEEYFVPWVKPLKMYVSGHIDLAWKDPSLHRMMSNENPIAPSPKVMEAIMKYGSIANRYPDQGLILRGKIARDERTRGSRERRPCQRFERSVRYDLSHVSCSLATSPFSTHLVLASTNCGPKCWAANSSRFR